MGGRIVIEHFNVKQGFRRTLQVAAFAMLSLAVLLPASVQAGDAAKLAELLPNDINAVAIVRNKECLATPRAQQENWAAMADANFVHGQGGIPSWVETLVVGFQIRPASAEQVSATGVARVPDGITIQTLAEINKTPQFEIAGYPAIRGRGDSFVLEFSKGILGIRRPAVRQETARWAGDVFNQRTGNLTPFLKGTVEEAGQILFAIDLENAFDPELVRSHLATGAGSSYSAADQERLTRLISGIKDVTLALDIDEKTSARVVFEFSDDIGDLTSAITPVFMEILDRQGVGIDDFEASKITSNGKFATLTSAFSDESIHRVLSLITIAPNSDYTPPPSANTPPASTSPASTIPTPTTPTTSSRVPPEQPDGLVANRTYFQAIDRMLNDLDRSSRRSNNAARIAGWHENYANKIDVLSVQGVDPELASFGASVASKLRALSRSLQGQVVAVNAQQGTLTYDAQFNPGWASMNVWGGIGFGQPSYQIQSNLQQVRERQAAAITAGAEQRIQIWGMITEERAAILRTMTQRYGNDFTRTSRR